MKWTKETDLQVDCFGNRWSSTQQEYIRDFRAKGLCGPLAACDMRGNSYTAVIHVPGHKEPWFWIDYQGNVYDDDYKNRRYISLDELIFMSIAKYSETDDWSLPELTTEESHGQER